MPRSWFWKVSIHGWLVLLLCDNAEVMVGMWGIEGHYFVEAKNQREKDPLAASKIHPPKDKLPSSRLSFLKAPLTSNGSSGWAQAFTTKPFVDALDPSYSSPCPRTKREG